MYKYKNGKYEFLQPKKYRKIRNSEYILMGVSVYAIYSLIPWKLSIKSAFVFFVLIIYFAGKFIAPTILRRYNLIIYNNQILLETYDCRIQVTSIEKVLKINDERIRIVMKEGVIGEKYYEINLENGEPEILIEIYTKIKEEILQRIRDEIDDSIK